MTSSARKQQPDDVSRPQRQLQIVGRDDDSEGTRARQPSQQSHQLDARRDVEKRRRLVEDQQHRLLCQRSRDHDPLPLTVGNAAEVAPGEVRDADGVDCPLDDLVVVSSEAAEPARMRIPADLDDPSHGERFDNNACGEHDANLPRDLEGGKVRQIDTIERDIAPERRLEPGHRSQQR
jgi:hypothetical protein